MVIGASFGFNPGFQTQNKQPMMSTNAGAKAGYISNKGNNKVIEQKKQTTQVGVPQKQMMSYNVQPKNPSKKYPGIEQDDEDYIEKTLAKTGLDETQKSILREQAVKNFIDVKQAKAFLEDRESVRSEIASGKINLGDKKTNDYSYKTAQFADLIRKDALGNGFKQVTQTDDKQIIDSVLSQKPEIKKDYERFLNGEISINNLNRIMQGGAEVKGKFANRLADNVAPKLQSGVEAVGLKKQLKSYQEENKQKTFKDVATKDFGAAPSVIVGAATVPARQITNLLGGDTAKIDDVVDYLGVKKDGWFNAGKIASEIGVNAIETAAGMKLLNIGQLGAILAKNPSRYKRIAKPVLEAVGFTLAGSLTEGKMAKGKEFITNTALNLATSGLANLRQGRTISKGLKTAAERVESSTIDDYIKSTKELKVDWNKPNPLNKLVSKVDDVITKVDDDKGAIGQKLGSMRDKMKTVSYSIDDAVENINKSLTNNNIGASIIKGKGGKYTISTKLSKDSGKNAVLREVIDALNETSSKSLGISNKLAALDKVNQDIIYMVKSQAQGSPLGNALTKASKGFSETIENTMSGYGFTKGEYGKLANLKNEIKALSSDGKGAINILSKITGPGTPENIKNILIQLKELGYTTDDLVSEAIVANSVMAKILNPSELQRALETVYPSAPGLAEALIKSVKGVATKPLTAMREAGKGYIPKTKSDYIRGSRRMIQKRGPMKAIDKKDEQ